MAHKTFQEYLTHKNKLQNTGTVQQIADYNGPKASKPGKEKKHKDAGGSGQVGEPKPYGGDAAKDPNKGKNTDGFAGKGDKSLAYKPGKEKLDKGSQGVPGGKGVATWPKTKTQEWIDSTKGMSLAEFTKQIQKTTTDGLKECACQNTLPLEVVKQTVELAKANESVMASLVREMKRNKAFGKLVAEMLQHEETYGVIAKFMENDEKYARKLVRAMNEMVGPPAHKDMGEDEDEMGHDHKKLGDEDFGGDEGDMGGDLGDDMGDEGDLGDDMGGDLGDDMGGSPHGDEGDPASDIAPGSKIMPPKKKKKKLHAHDHLMNAMKDSGMGGDMGMGM